MDIRDLRYFVAAAEIGYIHHAAAKVGRSQPAITKSIRRLESELGTKLFEPEGRGLRLTSVGQTLLVRARALVRSMSETIREVTELSKGYSGHVRIGAGPTMAEWLLPSLVNQILALSPGITFDMTTGLADVLRQALRDGHLDFVVGPLSETDKTEFTSFVITGDTVVVAVRDQHPLFGRPVTIQELEPFGWLLPRKSVNSTTWLNRVFDLHELPKPRVQIETDTVLMLRRIIAQTDLITFISRRDLAMGDGIALREIPINELSLHRHLGLVQVANRYMSPAAEHMVTILRDSGKMMILDEPCLGIE
jgi:DNA-binding transcriptional LysR family regulator